MADTPTPVPPALTPTEWRSLSTCRDDHAGVVDDDWCHITAGRVAIVDTTLTRPHAVAALCLYNQPFGFTPRMVDLLNWTADNWKRTPVAMGGFGALAEPDPRDELRELACRIAALLPPAKETP